VVNIGIISPAPIQLHGSLYAFVRKRHAGLPTISFLNRAGQPTAEKTRNIIAYNPIGFSAGGPVALQALQRPQPQKTSFSRISKGEWRMGDGEIPCLPGRRPFYSVPTPDQLAGDFLHTFSFSRTTVNHRQSFFRFRPGPSGQAGTKPFPRPIIPASMSIRCPTLLRQEPAHLGVRESYGEAWTGRV